MNEKDAMRKLIDKHIKCVIKSKKYRNIKTGEITTQIPIFEIDDYVEVE